jgi:hypothetical protein
MTLFDVNYNGIFIKNVETVRFEESVEMDESRTDILFHRFRMRFRGLVHSASPDINIGYSAGPGLGVASMVQLRTALMHHRGSFTFYQNSEVLLHANGIPGHQDQDVNNGPKPLDVSIVHFAGGQVFRLEFEIEVCKVECGGPLNIQAGLPPTMTAGTEILNHRWSVSDSMDGNHYTTRTWEGVMVVKSITVNRTTLRQVVVPPLLPGYRRNRQRFTKTPDGLRLTYTIEDQQLHAAPPFPATDWDGSYSESVDTVGKIAYGEFSVMLTGGPRASKKDLLVIASQLMSAKIGDIRKAWKDAAGEQKGKAGDAESFPRLLNAAITEDLKNNRIGLRVRVIRLGKLKKFLNTQFGSKLGDPLDIPEYDEKDWPVPPLIDETTPTDVFIMYLQDPCHFVHGQILPPDQPGTTLEPVQPGYSSPPPPEVIISPGIQALQEDTFQRDEQIEYPYMSLRIDSRYKIHSGSYQLPIARETGSQTTTGSVAVNVHRPIARREVYLSSRRIGAWPEFPGPEVTSDPNGIAETFLDEEILTAEPELLADGVTPVFKVEVRRVYALARAPTTNEQLRVPQPTEFALDGNYAITRKTTDTFDYLTGGSV